MSNVAHQSAIVAALRISPPDSARAWTPPALARATGLAKSETMAAIQSLRFAGKIRFDALALSPSMLVGADAAEPVRSAGPAAPPAPAPVVVVTTKDVSVSGAERLPCAPEGAGDVPLASPAPPSRRPVSAAAIVETVKAEAVAQGDRRRVARMIGSPAQTISPTRVALQAALLEQPEDGFAFLRRKWPDLLRQVLIAARHENVAPGPMLARIIETGLANRPAPKGERG